ncbi:MAG: GTP-binding protein [Nanoarchaeota archaeon]|nr:GTP-binding protein [Nanoarchaeota archaeon]
MESYKRKILLLGDGAVGKTSLVRRFVDQRFDDKYIQTIGANVKKKTIDYENLSITLLIYDLIGQQGFQETQKANMSGANAALMVCDLTRIKTTDSLEDYWIGLLKEVSDEETPPMIFLANKSDLIDPEGEEAREFRAKLLYLSEKYNAKFYFTSAKTGANVEIAFRDIGLLSLSHPSIPYFNDNVYNPKGEVSPTKALDLFMSQLTLELGDEELASSIIKKQIADIGIDINNPTKEKLEELVKIIKETESVFVPEDKREDYYLKRRNILAKVK